MRQVILFLLAGGVAALANILSRAGLSKVMPYVPSIVVAYCIGMITAFVLNRLFVFTQATNRIHHQALWFVAINIAAILQTLAISLLLARWLLPLMGVDQHVETIAHVIGVLFPVFTSYFGHKHLSFKSQGHEESMS